MEKVCGGNEVSEQLKRKKEKKDGRRDKGATKARPTPMAQFRKRSTSLTGTNYRATLAIHSFISLVSEGQYVTFH